MTSKELMKTSVVRRYKVLEKMLNVNHTLFGGEVMGWMDKVGHSLAVSITNKTMYTLTADKIKFLKPAYLNEIIEVKSEPLELGAVKLSLQLTAIADPDGENRRTIATGIFTFVQVDEATHRPQRISYPMDDLETYVV